MRNSIIARRTWEWRCGLGVLALLAVLPLPIRDVYTENLIIITILFAGLAQAWNILGGYCGQISLGHALYFGAGAYVSTLLFVKLGIPPTIGMFAGGLVGGAMALLVGWPCFRLSGHYYAIATVVVGEIGYLLFLNWDFVGGATGVYIPFKGESWIALQFRTQKLPYHYLVLAFVAATWIAACDREQEVLTLLRELGLEQRLRFTGFVSRDAVPSHVAAFDIALQPAVTSYASPLKLFEDLALGKAIVAPRLKGPGPLALTARTRKP